MPPTRRARGRGTAHCAAPYRRGWLPWSSGDRDDDGGVLLDNDNDSSCLSRHPDDVLSPVLARLPSAADVVRAAVTSRRWARIVAKDAAVLSSGLPDLPGVTLGFFYQGSGGARARGRRRPVVSSDAVQTQPCFVPTAAVARVIGLLCPSWTALADAVMGDGDHGRKLLEHAWPVAARNGWLVLELQKERYTDGVTLLVCNPTRVALLPPLAGADNPGEYGCALYTGHDQDPPRPSSAFFRLVIVYNRRSFTALRSYSSDTQRWSAECRRSGPKMASHEPRELGQSIVVRGVAYWLLRDTVFAVWLPKVSPVPASARRGCRWQAYIHLCSTLLGQVPCSFISPWRVDKSDKYPARSYHLGVWTRAVFRPSTGTEDEDDDDGGHDKWESTNPLIRMRQLKIRSFDEVNLQWFYEKSGNLIFTLGEGTSSPGAFVVNMATEHVKKLAHGVDCESWEYLVGYEMDGAAYLASISRRPPYAIQLRR